MERHLIDPHTHRCGHRCACALPDHPLCVDHELQAAAPADRARIWAERWPAHRPHPRYDWRADLGTHGEPLR